MPHEGQHGIVFQSGGYKLLGTLYLARDDTPKPTALILHGLPGIEKNVDIAHALRKRGWNSLIFHYRGCWGSEGDYTLATIPDDVSAAIDDLCSGAYPQVDPAKLVLIGHSLGGWAAVLAGVRDERAKAVAIYGAVADPRLFPVTPAIAEAEFTPWLSGVNGESFAEQWSKLGDDLNPVEQVEKISPRPLLIIHGARDEVLPHSQAEALSERAKAPHQIHLHPEANHAFSWHRAWLREQIVAWLEDFLYEDLPF